MSEAKSGSGLSGRDKPFPHVASLMLATEVGSGLLAGGEPERLDHHPEHFGIVHLAVHALTARPHGGEDDILAGMDAGVDHGGKIAEAQHSARDVLVLLVGLEGVGLGAGLGGGVGWAGLGRDGLV